MTLAWAIIVVAVLYLLDKHNLLKKALKIAGIGAGVMAIGVAAVFGCVWLRQEWKDQQLVKQARAEWAAKYECFDPASAKAHPGNESDQPCASQEIIHRLSGMGLRLSGNIGS